MWEDTGVWMDTKGRCWRSHRSEGRAGTGTGMDETSMHWQMNQLHPGSADVQFVRGLSILASCS